MKSIKTRGKAGGHEPPLFPLPYHHIWLFKTTFLNGIIRAFKVWFLKIQQRQAKKHNSNHFLNSKLDWYFVCWILKLFYNEIFDKFDWVLHLKISQSVMIIQLLTHYTKSMHYSVKKLMCGIERQIVVAHGRLLSPTPRTDPQCLNAMIIYFLF